jgi:MoaA/NifB/PqqE/SkfB family radical SAM enzyme
MQQAPRTASIVTNLRCNQACVYCDKRAPEDDRAFIRGDAVRARIDAGISAGSREIVLTGGEPSMRTDLEALVSYARARGAERVVLETNATLVDEARAKALREAGLDVARVNWVGASDDAVDAVTRDPGGFARTIAGARALASAGVAIEASTVITNATIAHVGEVPDAIARELAGAVTAIVVGVPVTAPDDSGAGASAGQGPGAGASAGRGHELVTYERAAPVVVALERRARALGIAVRMSADAPMPPCTVPPRERTRIAHLWSMTRGAPRRAKHTHVDACERCSIADRCSGVADAYLARHAAPAMHPIDDERTRRRLAIISTVGDQIARELVSRSLSRDRATGEPVVDEVVRINFQCNQSCTFCFVSTHLPPATDEAIEAAIRDAGARGSRILVSGGEPTINARVVEWVRLAKSVTAREVSLQTNAVRLDDARLVADLERAGLDEAFVSLHGCTPETSDAVTEAPGTFARTVAGIDNLYASAIRVTLNFVVCEKNRHELPAYVRFVATRWPRALLNVSFVAPSADVVPRDRGLVPRYTDVMPALAEAIREARRLDVELCGFESMCGIPLCLVPEGFDDFALVDIPPGSDGGEFVRAEACDGCKYRPSCYGVRRGYAELYGTNELVRREP